jgi:hypothetical protein
MRRAKHEFSDPEVHLLQIQTNDAKLPRRQPIYVVKDEVEDEWS